MVFFSRTLEIRKSDYYYFFFLETKRPGIKIPSVTDTVDFTSSSDEQKRKLLEEIIFRQFNLLENRTDVIKKSLEYAFEPFINDEIIEIFRKEIAPAIF